MTPRGKGCLGRVKSGRRTSSPQFNRAIFDALIYFHSQPKVRNALRGKRRDLEKAYGALFESDTGFLKAVESDTAGAPNTSARLYIWAKSLSRIVGFTVRAPQIPLAEKKKKKKK